MPVVKVRAKREGGFFRAGRLWPVAGEVAEVSDEQLAALEAEPMLTVSSADESDLPTPAAADPEMEAALREAIARIDALEGMLAAATERAEGAEKRAEAAEADLAELMSKPSA